MNDVRTLCAWMARRAPVRLSDGRTGIITRVVTSYPDGEIDLHVWTDGDAREATPGPSKVRASDVEADRQEPRRSA